MSIIIGVKCRFAIEYELQSPDSPEWNQWLPGHLRFLVNGERVGNYERGAELTVALGNFSSLLRSREDRRDERLLELPLVDAFRQVYSALYVDSGQSSEQVERAQERYARFISVPTSFDVFDGWMAFLVEDEVRGRYMWRDPGDTLHEAWLHAGEFDEVIEAFLSHLEETTGQRRRST